MDLFKGEPPPPAGPTYKLVQLKAGQNICGIVLSSQIWGVMTHWNDGSGKKGRSQRCTQEIGDCLGCERELPKRWKGYLHVYDFFRKCEVYLEITPASAEMIKSQLPSNFTLRGFKIDAQRSEGGNNGRLKIVMSIFTGDLEKLPSEKNPEDVLEILWNWRLNKN